MNSSVCVVGLIVAAAWLTGFAGNAQAQAVKVQQPVLQQFGVNTVVRAPDRGSLLIGGASAARTRARWRAPSLPGSQAVRSVERSTTRVHVFVHDFEAMDKAVLGTAGPLSTESSEIPSDRGTAGRAGPAMASHAQQMLLLRYEQSATRKRSVSGERRSAPMGLLQN